MYMGRQRDPRVFSPEWARIHFVYDGFDFWVDTSSHVGDLGIIVWWDSPERGWTITDSKVLPRDLYAAIKIWVLGEWDFTLSDFLSRIGFGVGTPDAIPPE